MPVYTFKGTNRAGAAVGGERVATNRAELQALLRRENITATMITEKGKEFALPKFGGGVAAKDLAIFTRQFSVMIDAGLPLVQCLEILGSQQENKAFQRALLGVRQAVEGGSTLANALRQHPKVFDDLYTNMIEAGETGGILDAILQRLSSHIEKDVKLKRAVVSAAIYPSATLGIAGGVILLLLWKVVPIFGTLSWAWAWSCRCPQKSSSAQAISLCATSSSGSSGEAASSSPSDSGTRRRRDVTSLTRSC